MATIQELAARLPASFGEQLGRVVRVAPGAEAVGLVSQSLAQLSGVLVARLPGADADQVRQVVGRFFRDYDECSDALQAGITRALGLLFEQALGGRAAAPDEVQAVAATVLELRTPQQHGQTLGVDLAESEQPHVETAAFGGRPILDRLDREEAAFADRLRGWLTARGMSQQEFADRLGVRPSAVSMMLGRKCRPQRRTVERAAHILGVSPADLWPGAAAAAPG
ncbi:MAG: helix-turn-helix domain-containing protein, partial [Gemmataceae bacterium]|nr:helix-turn-helix domain-containing protein [Gemmataceae bacterium]